MTFFSRTFILAFRSIYSILRVAYSSARLKTFYFAEFALQNDA